MCIRDSPELDPGFEFIKGQILAAKDQPLVNLDPVVDNRVLDPDIHLDADLFTPSAALPDAADMAIDTDQEHVGVVAGKSKPRSSGQRHLPIELAGNIQHTQ